MTNAEALTLHAVGVIISTLLVMFDTKGFKPEYVDSKFSGYGGATFFCFCGWATVSMLILYHSLKRFL